MNLTSASLTAATAPLQQLLNACFDEVLVLRTFDDENEEGKNVTSRWLQTKIGQNYIAKDRSGKLEGFESPDLAAIINKLGFAGGAA